MVKMNNSQVVLLNIELSCHFFRTDFAVAMKRGSQGSFAKGEPQWWTSASDGHLVSTMKDLGKSTFWGAWPNEAWPCSKLLRS